MANNKYAGYTPDPKKEELDQPQGQANRLDRINPYEFRKGMDYELTAAGVARLAESTVEQREEATETVLKNLEEHDAYYSALIQFEGGMNQGSKITENTFKKFLETYTGDEGRGDGMKEVQNVWKKDKMKDADHKNDKMEEPKTKQLKEAIKKEIRSILNEWSEGKKKSSEDKESVTTAKGKARKIKAKESEIAAEKKAIAKNKKTIAPHLKSWNAGKLSADDYRKNTDAEVKDNKERVKKIKELEKEIEDINLTEKLARREVAKTMMEKETHMEILSIIKEYGISLREGSDSIKPYYEIAKTAYQEGIIEGMRKITEEH